MASETEENCVFIGGLISAVPEAEPLLQQHIGKMDGELIPYAFMDALAMWLIELDKRSAAAMLDSWEASRILTNILRELEAAYDPANAALHNLIGVGILETLDDAGDRYPELVDKLGPRMKADEQKHPHKPRPRL